MYSTWKFSTNAEDTWQQHNYANISDFFKNIYILPPELFDCRRTTCSRASLIIFSSSSSDRASAISPFIPLSPQTLLLRVCLEEMESKHRQRRHRHYQQLLSVLASLISTSTTPQEKFDPTPSTFRHGAPLRFFNGPVRCPTAAVVSKKQLFIFHIEFKKGKCCRLFFPEFPAGREIANRDARAPATWRHPLKP